MKGLIIHRPFWTVPMGITKIHGFKIMLWILSSKPDIVRSLERNNLNTSRALSPAFDVNIQKRRRRRSNIHKSTTFVVWMQT